MANYPRRKVRAFVREQEVAVTSAAAQFGACEVTPFGTYRTDGAKISVDFLLGSPEFDAFLQGTPVELRYDRDA